ncbi:MAG: histidine phosphatase family protein [Desulfovibrionaceae bacterium]
MIPSEAGRAAQRCGAVYFTRHCRTEWNDAGRLQGGHDIPLSAAGRDQARNLAQEVLGLGVGVLVTSTQQRAYETAAIIGERCGARVVACNDLCEIRFGDLEGMTLAQCAAAYPDIMAAWRNAPDTVRFPGGDAVIDFEKRVAAGLRLTLGLLSEPALYVLHGGVLRMARCLLEERSVAEMNKEIIPNAALYRLNALSDRVEMNFYVP